MNSITIQEENRALKGKRAKWVNKEELAQRRAEKRYLRCGRKGYNIRKCPLSPAVPPATQAATQAVNTAAKEED